MGRDGKPIWRNSTQQDTDPFANAIRYAPPGWVYEWKRYSVHNKVEHGYLSKLARDGWTAVQGDRHPGVFTQSDDKGHIVHDGMILMERPLALHREAQMEEKRSADSAVNRASRERGLQAATPGINTQTLAAKQATFVKTGRALDDEHFAEDIAAARPAYDRNISSID
jgi:hypothetical protein